MSFLIDEYKDFLKKIGADINLVKDYIVFDITSVAQYIKNDDSKGSEVSIEDFPCIRPPFQKMWTEYRWQLDGHDFAIGHIITSHINNSDEGEILIKFISKIDSQILMNKFMMLMKFNKNGFPIRFFDFQGLNPFIKILYDKDSIEKNHPEMVFDKNEIESQAQAWADIYTPTITPLLLAMSFMSCKNVQAIPKRNPDYALNKNRIKSGKLPLTKIYTLAIGGVREIFKKYGKSESFSKNAFHICRGHFKDFTHGAGLFGKYKGRYWWDSISRGSKEYGEIIKNYKVKSSHAVIH